MIKATTILTTVRITFDKEKRRCVWYLQVFSLRFKLPSIKRNEDAYGMLQVFSSIFESPSTKEERSYTQYASGILIDIRITFDKKRNEVIHSMLQVFSSIFESPLTKEKQG